MSISSVNSYGRFERDKYEYEDKYQVDRCPIYICPLGDLNKYMSDTNISSVTPTGVLHEHKSVIRISSV